MVHVKRTPVPKALDGEDSPGGRERTRLKNYYDGKLEKKPGISAYNHENVVLEPPRDVSSKVRLL